MYVDAAYCYRPTSMVCWCLSLTVVSPAKMAEPIEVLFGLRTWVGPRNHVLDGGSDLPMEKGNFGWRRLIIKYRDFLQWAVQKWLNRSRCHLGCGLGWPQGMMYKMGSRSPRKGQFLGKGAHTVKYRDGLCAVSCAKTAELIDLCSWRNSLVETKTLKYEIITNYNRNIYGCLVGNSHSGEGSDSMVFSLFIFNCRLFFR